MATHSSILGWRIPGTEEPGGLLNGNVIQMHVSDSEVGKTLQVLSESCEITHRCFRKRELFNFSSSEGGMCVDNHEVRPDSNTN